MPIDLNVRQISKARRTKAALDRLTNLYGAPKTISIYQAREYRGRGGEYPKKSKPCQLAISLAQRHAKTFSQVNHLWDIINPFLGFTQANTSACVSAFVGVWAYMSVCVCASGT